MTLKLWFHHLLQPHCPECAHDKSCQNCDVLRQLLEAERVEKTKLLQVIVSFNSPSVPLGGAATTIPPEPLRSRHVPWSVKRQMLEADSRKHADLLKEKIKEIQVAEVKTQSVEELEKELGVTEEQENAN